MKLATLFDEPIQMETYRDRGAKHRHVFRASRSESAESHLLKGNLESHKDADLGIHLTQPRWLRLSPTPLSLRKPMEPKSEFSIF